MKSCLAAAMAVALSLAIFVTGCSSKSDAVDEFNTTRVTLPDGTVIRAEVMRRQEDMMRGMMFRDSLPEDRGMLFIHGSPGKYTYYMYQVKVPLDIIWLDSRKNVVEISENTPPCKTNASQCPLYGGTKEALVVLELAGGAAKKHGIRPGTRIDF
jgi:uncharacterized membrane protein (UPF0127 family)